MDTTVSDPLVGRLLDERYEVTSRIARGGMATVYLARDRRLERDVALKVLHHHLADDVEFTVRFVREARSAAQLSHPNVVQVYDQGEDGGNLYLAMEYLQGRTLRDVLVERGVLTPRQTLMVAESVLDALAAAHRAGIVHRDVKPENVVLTDEGRIKVADFGLARAASASTATSSLLLGTVAYLSPELVGRGIADARSDVYAVGVMLYEMLTGRQPFTGDVPIQVAYRHVHEDVPPPSAAVPDLAPELDDLVVTAAARDPDRRPADAGVLLAMVRRAHAALTDVELDARAPRSDATGSRTSGGSGWPRPSAVPAAQTQLVGSGAGYQSTAALPGRSPAGRARAGAAQLAPRGRSDDLSDERYGHEPPDEDAELALLGHRRRRRGLLGLLVVLSLALFLGAYAWFFAAGPGSKIPMPLVVGLSQSGAEQALHGRGLKDLVELKFDTGTDAGQVISSEPSGGGSISRGGTATLVISKGPDLVTVPPVAQLSQNDAEAALRAAGLQVGDTPGVYDSSVPSGNVVAADPPVGGSVLRGGRVSLSISQGPQPVNLPDLTDQTQGAATSTLTSLGLNVTVTQSDSPTVQAGSVISQSPPAGQVSPGSTVTLVVSSGPATVMVPDVTGQPYDQAKQTLLSQGLMVQRVDILGGFFRMVRSQDPAAGQVVPKGSTVLLTVE